MGRTFSLCTCTRVALFSGSVGAAVVLVFLVSDGEAWLLPGDRVALK